MGLGTSDFLHMQKKWWLNSLMDLNSLVLEFSVLYVQKKWGRFLLWGDTLTTSHCCQCHRFLWSYNDSCLLGDSSYYGSSSEDTECLPYIRAVSNFTVTNTACISKHNQIDWYLFCTLPDHSEHSTPSPHCINFSYLRLTLTIPPANLQPHISLTCMDMHSNQFAIGIQEWQPSVYPLIILT